MQILRFLVLAVALCLGPTAYAADAAPTADRVVVELFTSQGCSSCPPADELFGQMSTDPSVVSISWHVDYWNDLGWTDTLSQSAFTMRQKSYIHRLGLRFPYTPQVVVNGRFETVGNKERKVKGALRRGRETGLSVALDYEMRADGVELRIGGGDAEHPATLWMVRTLSAKHVTIGAGENKGRTLTYTNVARDLQRLGTWTGEPQTVMIDKDALSGGAADGCAILLQEAGNGPILGAVSIPPSQLISRR